MENKEYLLNVGMEVKVARMRKRLTIKELGKLTGLSENAICQIEGGKKDFHILTIKRIADALELPVKDFM